MTCAEHERMALQLAEARRLNAELLEALEYWVPTDMPFPDSRRDLICESHNIKWEKARAAIAKAKL